MNTTTATTTAATETNNTNTLTLITREAAFVARTTGQDQEEIVSEAWLAMQSGSFSTISSLVRSAASTIAKQDRRTQAGISEETAIPIDAIGGKVDKNGEWLEDALEGLLPEYKRLVRGILSAPYDWSTTDAVASAWGCERERARKIRCKLAKLLGWTGGDVFDVRSDKVEIRAIRSRYRSEALEQLAETEFDRMSTM